MTYYIGQKIRVTGTFTTLSTGAVADPTTITVQHYEPGGTTTSYVYGTDDEVGKTSTGIYYYEMTPDTSGVHEVRFVGTGAVVAAKPHRVTVKGSLAAP